MLNFNHPKAESFWTGWLIFLTPSHCVTAPRGMPIFASLRSGVLFAFPYLLAQIPGPDAASDDALLIPQSLRDSPQGHADLRFTSLGRPFRLSVFRFAKYPARTRVCRRLVNPELGRGCQYQICCVFLRFVSK